jgi:hypothetical protein
MWAQTCNSMQSPAVMQVKRVCVCVCTCKYACVCVGGEVKTLWNVGGTGSFCSWKPTCPNGKYMKVKRDLVNYIRKLQTRNIMFQTAGEMKMAVFCVVAPCILVEVYQRFRGTCCLHHQGDEWVPWWWRQQVPLKRW